MFGTDEYMTLSPWIILGIILVCIVIIGSIYSEKIKERLFSNQVFQTRYNRY